MTRPSTPLLALLSLGLLPLSLSASPKWQKMPLLSPQAKAAGVFPGGEGGQWPRDLVVSASDPDFLLLAIDVGGLYRTLDGGKYWEAANVGWNARGANAFAIDPRNADRVIGVGGNSLDWNADWGPHTPHGLYRSTDRGASWKQVLPRLEGHGGALAWDPASFDRARGHCTVAYFLPRDGGLFKTEDGGASWREVHPGFGDGRLKVHPTKGTVYLGGASEKTRGLFVSDDGGTTFTKVLDEPVHGLDVCAASPDRVYLSADGGLRLSEDGGRTLGPARLGKGLEPDGKPVQNVTVSPADPERLAAWVAGESWRWVRYYSTDGGASWGVSKWDNTLATLPYNVRQGVWAYHPREPNVVYTLGGDWVTRSDDSGATFRWSANGYNGVMLGGLFAFSAHEPDTVFLAFQDYNGAFTVDGGATWNYRDVSGKGWGGFCYGGHAVDKEVMWAGDAPSWGGPRTLRVSRDGGATWSEARDERGDPVVFAGPDVSMSAPRDRNVCFASNWRSADKGKTWQAMDGCDGVYAAAPDGTLFGKKGDEIVRSDDDGATWSRVAAVPGGFRDLAYDHVRDRFYAASEDQLKRYELGAWTTLATPPDQYGGHRIATVAVDPVEPAIVYAGSHKDLYACTNAVVRSTDAGRTWENLTVLVPLGKDVSDGPLEVAAVRVHPRTREAWVNGQCYGMWRIAPPR